MKKRIFLLTVLLLCVLVVFSACDEPDVHTHTIVIDPAVEPTCTQDGKTEGQHCSTCNAILLMQVAIPKTGHSYASEWTTNETHHWHEPTCSDTTEVKDKGTHRFDNGVITTYPTHTEKGVKTYTCQDCYYTKTEDVNPVSEHTFASAWSTDETHHWHASTCGCQDQKTEFATHRFDNGTVTKQPTCTEKGEKTFTCGDCLYQKVEEIPTTDEHTFANTWSTNETHHWYAASCSHTSEKKEFATHRFDNGVVTKQPTCSAKGEKTYTCGDCRYQKVEEVPMTESHTFASAWSVSETHHWHASTCGCQDQKTEFTTHRFDNGTVTKQPTCTEKGEKTYTCGDCRYQKVEEIATIPHTYATAWSNDETHHWHASTCGCQDQESEFATHRFDNGTVTKQPTCTEKGEKTYTCGDCRYQKVEEIATIPHTYATAWSTDETYHWHISTCGCQGLTADYGTHRFDNGVITKPTSCTVAGEKMYTCLDCQYKKLETIPATGHSYSNTWSTDQNSHWHAATCSHTSEKKDWASHRFDDGVVTKEPTLKAPGERTYTCLDCQHKKVEFIYTALLEETKFSGKTCYVWQSNPAYYGMKTDFYVASAQDATTAVERAAWARLSAIKQQTGVTINVTKSTENSATGGSKDIQTLEAWLKTEDPTKIPDIVVPGAHTACVLMSQNYFCSLKGLYTNDFGTEKNYLDFTKDCWDQNINEAMSLAGEYYLVSGAYSISNASRAPVIYVDKTALSQIDKSLLAGTAAADFQDINTVYDWVKAGDWTWAKLLALSKAFTGENHDPACGKYGLEYQGTSSYSIYRSSGKHYVATDPNTLLPTSMVGETESIQVMTWLIDNVRNDSRIYVWGGRNGMETREKFGENHDVLFSVWGINSLQTYSNLEGARGDPFEFTVVPMPKFDYSQINSTTTQDSYSAHIGSWFIYMAAIPKHCPSPSFSSFVLQLMSEMGASTYADGVDTIVEAYLKDNLAGTSAPQELIEDPEVLQLILESASVDFGEAYIWSGIPNSIGDQVRAAYNSGDASKMATIHGDVSGKIATQSENLFWKLGIYQ